MRLDLGYRRVTIDGHVFYAHPITGQVYPEIRGGADGDEPGDAPKTFTQEDVDRLVGGARVEAKRVAANELAAELGCTVEEAKAKIATASAAEDAAKTEAQRDREAAAADKARADEDRRAAALERFAAKVERRLTAAGVDDKALARASRLVTLDPDADDDAITAEIEALKTDVPGLFTTTEAPAKPAPGTPAPKPPAAPAGGSKSMADLGRDGLARRGWATPSTAA